MQWLFFAFRSRKIVVSCHRVKNRKFLWYNSVGAFALAGMVFCRSNRKQRKGASSYSNRSCVLIVAGGGGGGGIDNGTAHKGGDGGGERGGNGSGGALGGRQISTSSSPSENFGMGDYYSSSGTASSGGGGGWFGGNYGLRGESGAGGSGYVDGVAPFTHNGKYYPAETEAGVSEGNGRAFIRYVECA